MAELLRVRDADGVIALYGDTARFVHVDNGEIVPWSRLAPMMRTFFATARENPITVVGEPGVVVMGRDHAVVVVVHRAQRQGEAPHEGVWTGVLHRDGGKWRIVHSHSSDRPQAGMDPHR
jgi:ketosteroid isomerase-like protein